MDLFLILKRLKILNYDTQVLKGGASNDKYFWFSTIVLFISAVNGLKDRR